MAEIKKGSQEDIEALKEAVKRIDPTFFGLLFDRHYGQLTNIMDDKETLGSVRRRALELTAGEEVIKRAGMGAVIKASRDRKWSEDNLSPLAKRVLDEYALEQEQQAQRGATK